MNNKGKSKNHGALVPLQNDHGPLLVARCQVAGCRYLQYFNAWSKPVSGPFNYLTDGWGQQDRARFALCQHLAIAHRIPMPEQRIKVYKHTQSTQV